MEKNGNYFVSDLPNKMYVDEKETVAPSNLLSAALQRSPYSYRLIEGYEG